MNQQGQSVVGIIITLVVVGIITGGFYLYLSNQMPEISKVAEKPSESEEIKSEETISPSEKSVTPQTKEAAPTETTSWETFTDKTFKFTVKCFPDWMMIKGKTGDIRVVCRDPILSSIFFEARKRESDGGLSLNDWLAQEKEKLNLKILEVEESEIIEFNGIPAAKLRYTKHGEISSNIYYKIFIIKENNEYEIYATITYFNEVERENGLSAFNQMLSTFRFLE